MKTIHASLQAHYDTGSTELAYAIVIRRDDGVEYGFTSHHAAFSMDCTGWGFTGDSNGDVDFDAGQGLSASEIVSTAGLNVDNLELTTLNDGSLFTLGDVRAGYWKSARFLVFRYRTDVAAPAVDVDCEELNSGWFGDVEMTETHVKVELRNLAQKLQQPVGIVSTKTCRARLGSTTGHSKCMKNLTSFTFNYAVTGVTNKRVFTATGASGRAVDYFGEGLVTWTSGGSRGLTYKVRSFGSSIFTLMLPVIATIQVGDTFTAVAGCRHRLEEDCRDKFNNVLNFQGEPHRPTIDDIVS